MLPVQENKKKKKEREGEGEEKKKGASFYNLIHSINVKAFYLASKRVYYFTTKFHYVPAEFCLMELNFTLSNYLLEQTIFTE